jgi:hypothetical protein
VEFDGVCGLRFCGDVGDDFACVSELDGVACEIDYDLPEAAGIADQFIGHVGLDFASEFEAFLMRAQSERFHCVAETIAEIEVDCVDVELAGFDFGVVENVVDQSQQGIRGELGHVQVFALLGIEVGIEDEFGHADDAVHGSANLVAHGGEKIALRAIGGFG